VTEGIWMTEEQREIRRKKRVIEYAEKNGNIKTACRRFGIARSTFYLWRDRLPGVRRRGVEASDVRLPQSPKQDPGRGGGEDLAPSPDLPHGPDSHCLVLGAVPRHQDIGRDGLPCLQAARPQSTTESYGAASGTHTATRNRSLATTSRWTSSS
jgi:hypothetical protein